MIDPGMDVEEIFGDVRLPCELVRRINNSLTATELPDLPKKQVKTSPKLAVLESKTLAQVEKAYKYPTQKDSQPSPKNRSTMSQDEVDNTPATEVVQYDLGFDNILDSMGVGAMIADLDDGFDYDEEYDAEEESKSQTTTSTRK